MISFLITLQLCLLPTILIAINGQPKEYSTETDACFPLLPGLDEIKSNEGIHEIATDHLYNNVSQSNHFILKLLSSPPLFLLRIILTKGIIIGITMKKRMNRFYGSLSKKIYQRFNLNFLELTASFRLIWTKLLYLTYSRSLGGVVDWIIRVNNIIKQYRSMCRIKFTFN